MSSLSVRVTDLAGDKQWTNPNNGGNGKKKTSKLALNLWGEGNKIPKNTLQKSHNHKEQMHFQC